MTELPAPASPPNRLAGETSPYLLQHAENPVGWYPWGPEALARAEAEDRPIFLSIGYAACHWCHVMERESFCDPAIAALLNRHFVCIKVDREERPDLDEIYLAATIAMTGSGGWPTTLFLTPAGEPFFAGTYFPPTDLPGRPGLPTVVRRIAELWASERPRLVGQAHRLAALLRAQARSFAPAAVGEEALAHAVARLRAAFDARRGGFGRAPKFPAPLSLELLLRHHHRTGDRAALAMVTTTLDAMARGGIRDHLGGGFARYSTDAEWFVPHFEKMLSDQALLARVYADAWLVTHDAEYERVAREILAWVLADLAAPAGGFYAATDADSEGVEGKYFVWTRAEIEAELTAEEARAFAAYYDVSPCGNWEGKSILHTPRKLREVGLDVGCSVVELTARLEAARRKLRAVRARRVPPLCDDQILTAHNGLAISALAECGRLFGEPRFVAAAARAADFVWRELRRPDGRLLRAYRAGQARHDGVLEDHALFGDGLVDLYEATGEARFLAWAEALGAIVVRDFADEPGGGFLATARDHERLLLRPSDAEDGALPSGNATAARLLARLALFRDDAELRRRATDAVAAYGGAIELTPEAFGGSLRVVDLLLAGPTTVVLSGAFSDPRTEALRRELGRHYLPNRLVVHHDPTVAAAPVAPSWIEGRGRLDEAPAAFVCGPTGCQPPATDPTELAAALAAVRPAPSASPRPVLRPHHIAGFATRAGTRRYAERCGAAWATTGYCELGPTGLRASRIGFGSYRIDERVSAHAEALRQALGQGVNLVDTSTNYGGGGSERLIGRVLREALAARELDRDEVILVSKIGYVQGRSLERARARAARGEPYADMVRYTDDCWHCIHPSYLAAELERSLDRLGVETLDVCLVHNPEYFFTELAARGRRVDEAERERFYERLEQAFAFFEEQVRAGSLRSYGVSSNTLAAPASHAEATSAARILAAAERAGGCDHHLALLQLPVNLLESAAVREATVTPSVGAEPCSVLSYAAVQGLAVLANRPLNAFAQNELVRLADGARGSTAATAAAALRRRLEPALPADRRGEPLARQALYVLTSTPGLDVVLLGMRAPAYVEDAIAVLGWPPDPATTAAYDALASPSCRARGALR